MAQVRGGVGGSAFLSPPCVFAFFFCLPFSPHLIDDGGISSICVFDIDRSRRRPYLRFLVWEIILTERIWLSQHSHERETGEKEGRSVMIFASVCCVRHVVGAGKETTRIHCDHHHHYHHPSVMCVVINNHQSVALKNVCVIRGKGRRE